MKTPAERIINCKRKGRSFPRCLAATLGHVGEGTMSALHGPKYHGSQHLGTGVLLGVTVPGRRVTGCPQCPLESPGSRMQVCFGASKEDP